MATRFPQRLRHERRAYERERGRFTPPLRAVETNSSADEATAEMARYIYDLRRRRDALFGTELFSDPAWDLLLFLFKATRDGNPLGVSDACDRMAVPRTTALR